jgi:hypothetical protein
VRATHDDPPTPTTVPKPKRARSALELFKADYRRTHNVAITKSFHDTTRDLWAALPDDKRQRWTVEALADKLRADAEKSEYNSWLKRQHAGQSGVVVPRVHSVPAPHVPRSATPRDGAPDCNHTAVLLPGISSPSAAVDACTLTTTCCVSACSGASEPQWPLAPDVVDAHQRTFCKRAQAFRDRINCAVGSDDTRPSVPKVVDYGFKCRGHCTFHGNVNRRVLSDRLLRACSAIHPRDVAADTLLKVHDCLICTPTHLYVRNTSTFD